MRTRLSSLMPPRQSTAAFVVIIALIISLGIGCRRKSAGGSVTVRFVAMEYDTHTAPYWSAVKTQFEKLNPHIRVRISIVPWDQGQQKLNTLLSGGDAPDIANIATIWLPQYMSTHDVMPLNRFLPKGFLNRFIPLTLQPVESGGKIWGLPFATSVRMLYYNAGMLKAAGVAPPKTWADLLKDAQAVTKPGKVYGFGVQGKEVETDTYFTYFLWTNGGDILNSQGQCVVNSPAGVGALQFLTDLVNRYKVTEPQPTAYNREDLQDLFKAKKLAMLVTGPWFSGMLKKEAPSIHFGIVPVPYQTKPVTMAITDNLIMFRKARHPNAAWKFLQFVYNDQNRRTFLEKSGMLPELKALAKDPYYQDSPLWRERLNLLKNGKFVPMNKDFLRIQDFLRQAVQAAYLKQLTPKQALDQAATEINQILGQ